MLPRLVTWLMPMILTVPLVGTASGQAASTGSGQAYPNKPIRILASEPGAQVDLVARQIAPALTASLGQPVIVENRPGFIAVENAAKALPDGYTLVIYASSVWVSPLLQKVPIDPVKDLSPITLATNAPLFLFSHPSLPAKSIKELIALAKAKPGELNYGSSSAGTANHLAGELFKSMAAVDIVRIPYKGTGPAAVGLMANQVQLMFGSAAAGMPHVKGGRLRVLGVGSAQPSALAPEVPTISASGVPGYEAAAQACMWAPVKTSKAVISRLNQEILRVLNNVDVKEKFLAGGVETIGTTPEQTSAYIKADIAKWSKVIKEAGIKVEQ